MPRKRFTTQQEKEICSKYLEGYTVKKLANEFSCALSTISLTLKRTNTMARQSTETSRKYAIRECYFDQIDYPEKAYILGLLYADGCNETDKNRVRLGLHPKDIKLVEHIRDLIFIDYRPIPIRKASGSAVLIIINKQISADLDKHGVCSRKTFNLSFPKLEPSLVPHFIRGLNDGDGHINVKKGSNQCCIEYIGYTPFCKELQKVINKYTKLQPFLSKHPSANISKLCVAAGAIQFLDWIYKDSTLYMERKYNTYLEAKVMRKKVMDSKKKLCKVCSEKFYAKNLCQYHYYRHKRGLI